MRRIILLAAIFFAFTGCKDVLLIVKGIKNPKMETYLTSEKYLAKNDMDPTKVVFFKDLNSFIFASKKNYLQIPNAFFFDKKGDFVDYRREVSDCNAKVDDFIEDLNAFDVAKKDSTKTMNELEKLLVTKSKGLLSKEKADINVFITWARYAGTLNKEKAFDWVKLLEKAKQKGLNVNYYLLNCDYQENWNLTNEQKKDLGLN